MKGPKQQPTTQQPKSPTAFELAQLAVMIRAQKPGNGTQSASPSMTERVLAATGRVPPRDGEWKQPVAMALDLWHESTSALATWESNRDALKALREGLMTLPAREWQAHVDAYPGSRTDIDDLLDDTRVSTEQLKRHLIRDKSCSTKTRDRLFVSLIKWAADHGLQFSDGRAFAYPQDPDMPPQVTGRECRHFVEAHLARAREGMRRNIPPSLRRNRIGRFAK